MGEIDRVGGKHVGLQIEIVLTGSEKLLSPAVLGLDQLAVPGMQIEQRESFGGSDGLFQLRSIRGIAFRFVKYQGGAALLGDPHPDHGLLHGKRFPLEGLGSEVHDRHRLDAAHGGI